MFVNKLKKVGAMYKDEFAIVTSAEYYREFIKNIQKIKEKQLEVKCKTDKIKQMKRDSMPKIVILSN